MCGRPPTQKEGVRLGRDGEQQLTDGQLLDVPDVLAHALMAAPRSAYLRADPTSAGAAALSPSRPHVRVKG